MRKSQQRTIDFDCGIAYARIEAWLHNELALPATPDGWEFEFAHVSCRIRIAPLEPRPLGSVCIERCSLHAEGDADALDEFERLFTLRFMSAGG